jgi:hypothetical protein
MQKKCSKNDIKNLNTMLRSFNLGGQVTSNIALYGKNVTDISSVNKSKYYFDILVNDGYIKITNHNNYSGMIEYSGKEFISKGGYKLENKVFKFMRKWLVKYFWYLIIPIVATILISFLKF